MINPGTYEFLEDVKNTVCPDKRKPQIWNQQIFPKGLKFELIRAPYRWIAFPVSDGRFNFQERLEFETYERGIGKDFFNLIKGKIGEVEPTLWRTCIECDNLSWHACRMLEILSYTIDEKVLMLAAKIGYKFQQEEWAAEEEEKFVKMDKEE